MRVDMPVEIPTHPPTMPLSITSGNSATAIGLSGMRAAQIKLDSHAHNVANVQTPDFKRQVTTQTALPKTGGVDAQTAREPGVLAPFDRLAGDLVSQRMSLYSFAANLRTVQTEDHMLGTLLDTKA
jgi:flagellar hook protein FlgE